MPGLETNRLVLFCLVGKWVRVFDEERSKAKNLLKIKKSVVSCAPEDQGSSDQIALNKEVDTRQHWILVSIWCREPKQPISKNFPKYSLRDKFRQILFLYWGYLESGKTRSGIDISGIVKIVTLRVGAKAFPPLFGSFNMAFSWAKTLHGAPEENAFTAG